MEYDFSKEMKFNSILLSAISILTVITNSCGQQQETQFDTKFLPNKVYTAQMTTSSTSVMNFSGSEEVLNQLKANGMTIPMKVVGKQELKTISTTGPVNTENEYNFQSYYESLSTSQIINEIEQTPRISPVVGMTAYGRINSNSKLKIDSLVGDNLTNELKETLSQSLEGTLDQMKLPDNPIKVGESFIQEIPMSIPIAGMNPIQVIISTERTLKKIENEKAYFDLIQEVNLDFNLDQGDIQANGSGKGTSVYDIANSFTTEYKVDLSMRLEIEMEQVNITADIETSNSNITDITTR